MVKALFFSISLHEVEILCIVAVFVGLVAQSVEQRIENPRVGGSIPPQATIPSSHLVSSHPIFSKKTRTCEGNLSHYIPRCSIESQDFCSPGSPPMLSHEFLGNTKEGQQ